MARSSGRFARVKKPLKSDMNVVPYIDVMLVLLVIFMVTAPMITSSVKVDLPQSSSEATTTSSNALTYIVSLDKNGAYAIEFGKEEHNQLSLEEVENIL